MAGGQGGQKRFDVRLHVARAQDGAPVVDEVAQVGVHELEDLDCVREMTGGERECEGVRAGDETGMERERAGWDGWMDGGLLCFLSLSIIPSHQADRAPLVQDDVLQGHHVRVGQLAQDLDLPQGGDGDALRGRESRIEQERARERVW